MNYALSESDNWWFAWNDFYLKKEENIYFNNDLMIYELADNMDNAVNQLLNEVIEYLAVWEKAVEHFNSTKISSTV